jgi:glycine hydroxymethyltransferase
MGTQIRKIDMENQMNMPIDYRYLAKSDPEIANTLMCELKRQQTQVEMIASENFASIEVMIATGSVMTNKYAEGYPGRRYYGGCEFVDIAEKLAIERACKLFNCEFANVQPHSGAQANQAVFLALMQPGDTFLGMALNSGGHLTHGSKVNMSGKWFNPVSYGVDHETGYIDMEEVAAKAREHKPKVIIAGGSAYVRVIDFKAFREIADEVGAYLMVDMAHFAGLVAGKAFPSPLPHAHVVTTTTHKTLRGPRGGMILSNDPDLAKKINSAVFPGNQGGPLMHVIAAKAVAFGEALKPEFQDYANQVVKNARALAEVFLQNGFNLTSGGTDCHFILLDLRSLGINGANAQVAFEEAGMTCNKNSVPGDPLPPMETSGLRIGSPAGTTRGMKEPEFRQLGHWMVEVLHAMAKGDAGKKISEVRAEVAKLCERFPLYPELS